LEPVGFSPEEFECRLFNPSGLLRINPVEALVEKGYIELGQDGFYSPTEMGIETIEEYEEEE
jgi:hypothetical protein